LQKAGFLGPTPVGVDDETAARSEP